MNKMLTVTVNVLIWDKHASSTGIAALCVCLLGGSLYKQAPLREGTAAARELEMSDVDRQDVPLTASSQSDEETGAERR